MEQHFDAEFDTHGQPLLGEGEGIIVPTAAVICSTRPKKKARVAPPQGNRRAAIWDHFTFVMELGKDVKKSLMLFVSIAKSVSIRHIPDMCHAYKAYIVANPPIVPEFDQKVFCKMFAEAILFHSYPLFIVEHEMLKRMHVYLNRNVRPISRNTILRYCMMEHKRLKTILRDKLAIIDSRVCFTCDCWFAITGRGYLTLTAHYITNDWTLKSYILNFRYFPPPYKGVDIYAFVIQLLKEWKLEGKAFSMAVDNAIIMDVMISRLKSDLHLSSPLPFDSSVLREAVNYIGGSDSRMCKFDECVLHVNSTFTGKLRYDVSTRWNSTYLMMIKALEARTALDLFATRESDFQFVFTPEDWIVIDFVCKFLEPFYKVAVLFSGSDYPTANLYFANVVLIEMFLVEAHNHEVYSIRTMCKEMMHKYDKYWSNHSIILSIAVLLDPRFKLRFVKSLYSLICVPLEVEAKAKIVLDAFVELYKFYNSSIPSSIASPLSASPSSSNTPSIESYLNFNASNSSDGGAEFAVDAYLNSPLLLRNPDSDFDVLKFWQSQCTLYPVLARMAKDILAIPITSVASESSFSMGGRVLTEYRSSLLPNHAEAFVTTQNWLFGYVKEEELEKYLDLMKEINLDDDLDSLPLVGLNEI
ncbi:Zinc finger BED domain-containing protein RICESLEEPER 2 [Bienertia sinuspersici]